jgi:hypothetical protein
MATYESSANAIEWVFPLTDRGFYPPKESTLSEWPFVRVGRAVYATKESTESPALTVYEEPYIPPVDSTDPVISNFVPPIGTVIGRTDPIQFDVTDEIELASIFIIARYNDGSAECVWNNTSFLPRFLAGSSRVPITDGYRFTVRRTGGWITTPIIVDIVAVDTSGNVTTGAFA